MKIQQIESFHVIGIEVRTTNENGQATKDIPALWNRFFTEEISTKIDNKSGEELYCLYTDYESDYTKPYTTILGYRVVNLNDIPEGLSGKTISGGDYTIFTAEGKATQPFVYNEWLKIWNSDLNRKYSTDFEIYGADSQHLEAAKVDIYIALKA